MVGGFVKQKACLAKVLNAVFNSSVSDSNIMVSVTEVYKLIVGHAACSQPTVLQGGRFDSFPSLLFFPVCSLSIKATRAVSP